MTRAGVNWLTAVRAPRPVAADRQAVHLVFGRVLGRQEDDRYLVAAGIQALEHLHAIDVGEHHVEDDQGRRELRDSRYRGPSGRRGLDGEAFVAKGHRQQLGDIRLVVHDQAPGPIRRRNPRAQTVRAHAFILPRMPWSLLRGCWDEPMKSTRIHLRRGPAGDPVDASVAVDQPRRQAVRHEPGDR